MSKKILRQNRGILIFGERNSTDFVGFATRPVDRRQDIGCGFRRFGGCGAKVSRMCIYEDEP